jgi:o-succinylbenzoate---CoA ligase
VEAAMVEQWIHNGVWKSIPSEFQDSIESNWSELRDDPIKFKFFTSGTTGAPKEICFNLEQIIASTKRTAHFFNLQSSDRVLHTLPLSFVAGRMNILRALILKQTVYHLTDWKNNAAWSQLQEQGIDWWPCTPMMLETVIDLGIDTSFIKKILLGGAPVSERLTEKVQRLKSMVWEGYGMTETLTHIACRKLNQPLEREFTPLPDVQLDWLEENRMVIIDQSLHHTIVTQDRGEPSGNGKFLILGRMDDVINSGGIKIYPEQVEKILKEWIPGNFAVVKQSDEQLGEKVICLYEDPNWRPDDYHWKNIFHDCPYWRPKEFKKVEQLPYQQNGKLNRNWKG